ncbi:MAG: hypothetical protein HS099_29260 [Ardenticatenaceae bacterium]|nr:hypothetical protein [Ardenticatenaceae bacterium]MBE7533801.1 hypothetical protein [Ardenticatenaceae bacterium]
MTLLDMVKPLIPEGSDVIFLGDGEFDGVGLQAQIAANEWQYVCRTACNRILCDDGDEFSLQEIGLQPGACLHLPEVGFTQDNYGPVLVIAWWRKRTKSHSIW